MFKFSLFILVTLVSFEASIAHIGPRSCSQLPPKSKISKEVEIGWPLVIDCKEMEDLYAMHRLESGLGLDVFGPTTSKCVIVDAENGKKVFMKTYNSDEVIGRHDHAFHTIDALERDTTRNYKIYLEVTDHEGVNCIWSRIRVRERKHHDQSCLGYSPQRNFDKSYQLSIGAQKTFDCFGSMDADVRLSLLPASVSDRLNVRWFHNCDGEVTSDDVINDGRHVDRGHSLVLNRARFEHAGSYVCAVEYDGMTKFFNKWDICITPGSDEVTPRPMPHCPPPVIRARLGQLDFSVQLNVSLGQVAVVDDMWYEDEWKKDDMECGMFALPGMKTYSMSDNAVQCMRQVVKRQDCFDYVALGNERIPVESIIQSGLYFDQVRLEDFGDYTYRMSYFGSASYKSKRCHFSLRPV